MHFALNCVSIGIVIRIWDIRFILIFGNIHVWNIIKGDIRIDSMKIIRSISILLVQLYKHTRDVCLPAGRLVSTLGMIILGHVLGCLYLGEMPPGDPRLPQVIVHTSVVVLFSLQTNKNCGNMLSYYRHLIIDKFSFGHGN
jgi:hypothetical protein